MAGRRRRRAERDMHGKLSWGSDGKPMAISPKVGIARRIRHLGEVVRLHELGEVSDADLERARAAWGSTSGVNVDT